MTDSDLSEPTVAWGRLNSSWFLQLHHEMIHYHRFSMNMFTVTAQKNTLTLSQYDKHIQTFRRRYNKYGNHWGKKDDGECGICFKQLTYLAHKPGCGHLFCEDCLKDWLTLHCTKPTCPLCRTDVRDHIADNSIWYVGGNLRPIDALRFIPPKRRNKKNKKKRLSNKAHKNKIKKQRIAKNITMKTIKVAKRWHNQTR